MVVGGAVVVGAIVVDGGAEVAGGPDVVVGGVVVVGGAVVVGGGVVVVGARPDGGGDIGGNTGRISVDSNARCARIRVLAAANSARNARN